MTPTRTLSILLLTTAVQVLFEQYIYTFILLILDIFT
jgi:hypothetical protein